MHATGRTIAVLASAGFALGIINAAAADPTIVNGSFENPAEAPNSLTEITQTGIPGWTGDSIAGATHEYIINGNIEDTSGRNFGTTPFGDQYLGLNAIANRSFRSIESQSVSGFTVGAAYTLTVYIANLDGAPDAKVSVVASDGTSGSGDVLAQNVFTAPVEGPYGNGQIDFIAETLGFTATSDSVTFSIGNQSFTGVMGIDNVSLAAAAGAVPEPATWAMMILGAGLVGGSERLRRRRAMAPTV